MTPIEILKKRLLFETKQSNAFRFKRGDAKTEKAKKAWQTLIDLADESKDKLREQIKILESEGMKAPVKKPARKKSPTLKKVCSKVISRVGITSDGKLKPGYRWRKGGGSAIKVKPKVAKKPAARKPAARKKTPAKKKK